ncbi:MAG: hypothetical protein HYW50_05070 [Candidatus Diapherotrites archaeon]|nr:hypothetical protein [Candidatus Diapherotrites archaeon]
MGQKEFEKIIGFLKENNLKFELLEHEPVFTSEQAAKVRKAQLSQGVKAIVLKSSSTQFVLACVSGDKKIDLKKLAVLCGEKKFSLASAQEVLQQTGCEIGSVSPIGVVYPLPTYFDKKIFENEIVEFNVGLHTKSVRMDPKELAKALKPRVAEFSV